MKREWDVTDSMGNVHHVEYRAGGFGGAKSVVDGETYKVKSKNWFIQLADHQISLPGAECNLVVIGNNVRLAVNGTYLDDGTAYEPVRNTPIWVHIMLVVSIVLGYFALGLIGSCFGILAGAAGISLSLKKKTGAAAAVFVIFNIVAIAGTILRFSTM